MMKSSPRAIRRLGEGHAADQIVIRLPDPRLLRLVARSVLLAAAVLSFPLLRGVLLAASTDPAPAAAADGSRWIDDPFFLPMLLRDLRRQGLLRPGGRAVFLGDPSSRLPVLRRNHVVPVAEHQKPRIPDRTVDFVLAADGFGDASFGFVDRVLRMGGVTVVRLGSDPLQSFHLPPNYRMAYIRRFGSTVVAIKKIAHYVAGGDDDNQSVRRQMGRRLLAVPEARRAALGKLEDALLEPPPEAGLQMGTRFLPDVMGESLDGYPRRVFVDVVSPGRAGSSEWFEKQYPARGREFEMVSVDVAAGAAGGLAEWLARNVREEEFVVVKAEAALVDEVVAAGEAGLVDELFLECDNQWQKGRRNSGRAYWECLALYGRLRDEGVAVHQWWA